VVVEKVPRHRHNGEDFGVERVVVKLSLLCSTNVAVCQVLGGVLDNHRHNILHHISGGFCFLLGDFIHDIIQMHDMDFVLDVLGQNIKVIHHH
tara:strand:+ start:2746 stop:3024 length:279 start_codon:yes stop_codon:yes gene_type:complete